MSCQTESETNNKTTKKSVSTVAKEAAQAAIAKGDLKLLKSQEKKRSKYDLPQVLDSLMNLLDGLQYDYNKPEGIDSIKAYRNAFNQEIKVHLNKNFGNNWSQCLALKNIMEREVRLFQQFQKQELISQFIVLPGNIFFDSTTNQIDENGIKLIDMNILGLHETDNLNVHTLNVYIRAFYGPNSSAEAALKRSISLQKTLESKGLHPSRLRVQEHQPAILPDCSQCPFDIQAYANRVELSFDD